MKRLHVGDLFIRIWIIKVNVFFMVMFHKIVVIKIIIKKYNENLLV